MKLSENEIRAIKFYQGDVMGADPFWGDKKAYSTLNSLFFPGIDNEISRSREGKRLNPAFPERYEETINLCRDLLAALYGSSCDEDIITYRVERYSDHIKCREMGRTISFTSTSNGGFLRQYGDKKGIVLIKFMLPKGTPSVNMELALDHYLKAHESEVLLPPYLALEFEDVPLSEDEMKILDADGNPPVLSVIARAKGIIPPADENGIMNEDGKLAGIRIYEALNSGNMPKKDDIEVFSLWKEGFRKAVFDVK